MYNVHMFQGLEPLYHIKVINVLKGRTLLYDWMKVVLYGVSRMRERESSPIWFEEDSPAYHIYTHM